MKYEKEIKLLARYIIIAFIMYLAWNVTSIAYISALGVENATTLQVATGAIFGALTMILNFHFNSKVSEPNKEEK